MLKLKVNFLPLIIFGLITTSSPAHAGGFFDSISNKFTDISHQVSEKIKEYYGDEKKPSVSSEVYPIKVQTQTSIVPEESPLSQCRKFLGLLYNPYYEADPKKAATIYLNASLDFSSLRIDAKLSTDEIAERNRCAELALKAGADPDSNGRDKKDDGPYSFAPPVPLVRAVYYNNVDGVKLLLDHQANPNIPDTSMGTPFPLMNTALYKSQDIALALINAGIDLTTPHLLWIAAGNAADDVVDVLIKSEKIPVNELNKFTDYTTDEEAETALDSSESRLNALITYQKKISSNTEMSVEEKLSEVNSVLYYNYPLRPQLKMSETLDPDAYINELLIQQQNVSNSLKAAGGTCNLENCGIIIYSF